EHGLGAAPVVLVAPVRDELGEVSALGPVVPARVGKLLRESRARQTRVQVLEVGIGDRDRERLDGEGHEPTLSFAVEAPTTAEDPMDHTYKITEIVGSSPDGIDAAIRSGIARASKTLRNLDW